MTATEWEDRKRARGRSIWDRADRGDRHSACLNALPGNINIRTCVCVCVSYDLSPRLCILPITLLRHYLHLLRVVPSTICPAKGKERHPSASKLKIKSLYKFLIKQISMLACLLARAECVCGSENVITHCLALPLVGLVCLLFSLIVVVVWGPLPWERCPLHPVRVINSISYSFSAFFPGTNSPSHEYFFLIHLCLFIFVHPTAAVCALLENGTIALFGPHSVYLSHHVESISDALEIPHLEYRWRAQIPERTQLSINIHPISLTRAYVDIIHAWNWKSFGIVYEESRGEFFFAKNYDLFTLLTS